MERLNKYLARAGVASRRACDDLILAGRVKINDSVMRELGTKIDPETDSVSVDDSRVKPEKEAYWVVNKPPGYLCTNHDPAGRPLALDLVTHVDQRVFTVGRLDEGSEGMLILTNDGDLAAGLMHPRYGIEKGYEVLVAGFPTREDLVSLTEGIWLAEGRVQAKSVRRWKRQGDGTWLRIVLCEGKNREIRRMLARLQHKVMRLRRVSIGPIKLEGLPKGKSRRLSLEEVEILRHAVEKQKARRGLEGEPEREYELLDPNDVIGDEPEYATSAGREDEEEMPDSEMLAEDDGDEDDVSAPDDTDVAEALAFAKTQGDTEDAPVDEDEAALLAGLEDEDEDEDGDLTGEDEDGDLFDDEESGMDDEDETPAPKKTSPAAARPAPRPWQDQARQGAEAPRGGQNWNRERPANGPPSERPRGDNFAPRPPRPQGDRPQYQGDRPRFQGEGRPRFEGARPPRPNGNFGPPRGPRPEGNFGPPRGPRPEGNFGPRPPRPQGNFGPPRGPRPEGDRPRFEGPRPPRPQGDRPQYQGDRPRFQGEGRPRFEGPRPPRPQGDRPRFDGPRPPRPDGNFGARPPRPQGNFGPPRGPRPEGDRPRFDGPRPPRPQGDRPQYQGDRPRFDGPRPPRPEGNFGPRPQSGDRPRFEGPRPARPSGNYGPRPGGPPRPKRFGAPLGKSMRRKPDGK